jgi:tetratricopeptide (TPR) repeat protein
LLVSSLTQLAQYADAFTVVEAGLLHYPQDTELHFRRGIVLHHLERREEAIEAYRAALKRDDTRHFASVDPGIAGFKARHNMAVIYTELKQHDRAELQWRLALEEVPTYRPAWRGLCESLIVQKKFVTCDGELERWKSASGNQSVHASWQAEQCLLRFELVKAQEKYELANRLLDEMLAHRSDDPSVLRAASQFQFEKQDFTAAESSLTALTNLVPDDGAAWHNLGSVYAQQGHFNAAIRAFQVSLAVRPHCKVTLNQLSRVRALSGFQKELVP